MYEFGLVVGCAVAMAAAVALSRICVRSVWDGISVLGLFIVLYSLAGDTVGHAAEMALGRIGVATPLFSGSTVMMTSALVAVAILLTTCGAIVFLARHALGDRRTAEG